MPLRLDGLLKSFAGVLATSEMKPCCSNPASICYWFVVSLVAWVALGIIGRSWHPLHASSPATCLLAIAIGCFANAIKNRTYHCVLTGPLFLIAGLLLLWPDRIHVKPSVIWIAVVLGTMIAFLLEWRYARKLSSIQGIR